MGALKNKTWLLSAADFFWSGCVLAPLVVTYWRGTWDLLDDLLYPEKNPTTSDQGLTWYQQLSGLTSYLLGLFIRLILDIAMYYIKEFVENKSKWIRVSLTWIYLALYSIAGVAFWRGIWTLMTKDIGLSWGKLLLILLVALLLTLVMKAGKSLLSSPIVINLDRHELTFANGNYFKKTPSDKVWFIMDVLFTNLIMRHLVVFSWWSLWELENQFLLPKEIGEIDHYVSYDSLLMGYAAFIVTYGLDYLFKNLTSTKLYIMKPLYVLTILFGFFATVNVWRGLWSMLDHYFLPAVNLDENYILSHLIGLVFLTLAMAVNSISNDGIILDNETEEIVDIRYWNTILQQEDCADEMVPIVE